ncbi:hypothetical protein ILYODFUR_016146 [Ilyodon furcidens]|uniref:Uncharacterized protein n=1 Tax=Ilyodon furcidens TaxID=33524 RepID=A0ABV0TJ28_9TELE
MPLLVSSQCDTMKLSPHSSLERVKTETCFTSWENQRKAHTLAVNNDQHHKPSNSAIFSATALPRDGFVQVHLVKNVREGPREGVNGRCARKMSAESSLEKGLGVFMLAKWPAASCSSVQTS